VPKYLVLSFDGSRGWTKQGVSSELPTDCHEMTRGSGVFVHTQGDLLAVELKDNEPAYVEED
jgi:hypothetical protein